MATSKDLIYFVKKEDTRSRYSNSHCSLCRLHLAGPCADLFQVTMNCWDRCAQLRGTVHVADKV